jgi:hypothetical protein
VVPKTKTIKQIASRSGGWNKENTGIPRPTRYIPGYTKIDMELTEIKF